VKCLKFCLFALACVPTAPLISQEVSSTSPITAAVKPKVFITDSQSWEVNGSAGGSNGTFAAQSHGGARPQTAEIIKTFGEKCSEVVVNNKQDLADYIVVLDHEGGKGYLRHRNKVAVFEHLSGDVVISHSTLSLGGSVEDACNGIVQHWTSHSGDMLSAKQKASAPSSPTPIATPPPQLPSASQASLIIDSMPVGADIEIDGVFVGNTPSTISVDPGTHDINVKKKGFTVWTRKLKATSGSVHVNAELEPQATTTPASVNTPQ
jgi:PEGA domain-containing protein